MKHTVRCIVATAAAALMLGASASRAVDTIPEATTEAGAWQHHQAKFNFIGLTSAYNCDGLEGKVSQIMRFLGARKDIRVQAQGCPRGPESLSHMVWVTVDFDTLAAAQAGAAPGELVAARWTAFKINGQRPFFMGIGDCELIDAMKAVLTANFSLRKLNYDASCTPHQETFADFRVSGEVLKASDAHAG